MSSIGNVAEEIVHKAIDDLEDLAEARAADLMVKDSGLGFESALCRAEDDVLIETLERALQIAKENAGRS